MNASIRFFLLLRLKLSFLNHILYFKEHCGCNASVNEIQLAVFHTTRFRILPVSTEYQEPQLSWKTTTLQSSLLWRVEKRWHLKRIQYSCYLVWWGTSCLPLWVFLLGTWIPSRGGVMRCCITYCKSSLGHLHDRSSPVPECIEYMTIIRTA